MRLPPALLSLLLTPPISTTPPNTANRFAPRKIQHLLPKEDSSSSDCPTAYPTPRSSPPDTEPPYPIQITIGPPDSNSQQRQKAQDTGSDTDSNTIPTDTSQPRHRPPTGKKRPPKKKRDPNPPPPVEIAFAPPPGESASSSDSDPGPCTLFVDLSSPAAQASGAATVNVYALDGPSAGSLVGTTRFAAGEVATVNSFACREEQMCFRLEVAEGDGDGGGGVGFLQGDGEGMGLGMRYGVDNGVAGIWAREVVARIGSCM